MNEKEFIDYIMNLLLTNSNIAIKQNKKDLDFCFLKLGPSTQGLIKELRCMLLKLLNDEKLTKREELVFNFKYQHKRFLRGIKQYELKSILIDLLYNCYEDNIKDLNECLIYIDKLSDVVYGGQKECWE